MTHRTLIVALAVALAPALAAEASLPSQPPVLETQATPPAGMSSEHPSMSGLPLQVGDLPPGVVVARIIRRSFDENVSGQEVELHEGAGRVLRAVTDAEGRARFEGLRVGDAVQVRSVVDGELLGSQRIELPARGGVRLVLVAGVGAGMPPDTHPAAAPAGKPAAVPAAPAGGHGAALPLALGFISLGGGFVWFVRHPRTRVAVPRNGPAERPPDSSDLRKRRAALFARLLHLEAERARHAPDAFARIRDPLMDELVAVEMALDRGTTPAAG